MHRCLSYEFVITSQYAFNTLLRYRVARSLCFRILYNAECRLHVLYAFFIRIAICCIQRKWHLVVLRILNTESKSLIMLLKMLVMLHIGIIEV